jgi:orotidine-5'-phosphate decarboxylase
VSGTAGSSYLDRLAARTAATGTVLCLGLDPVPTALPRGFSADVAGIERFVALVLEAAVPFVAAVKPNLSFYEAFGSAGVAAFERLRARIPADVPVIADGKRGDIDTTSVRQSVGYFDALGVDAVTINPYVGQEALETYLERLDRFAYVLCRTSNPGAADFQALRVASHQLDDGVLAAPSEPLWARVARDVAGWGPGDTVGLVVGATAPDELRAVRQIAPALPVLVPGVGAQGGAIEPILVHGPVAQGAGRVGGGLLVNVSRGIASAALEDGAEGSESAIAARVAEAARIWSERLPVLP